MTRLHEVQGIDFDGATMLLHVDGVVYRVALPACSRRLADATDAERRRYIVSPSGYGVHWPEIDEDLSIDGLLRISLAEPSRAPCESPPGRRTCT